MYADNPHYLQYQRMLLDLHAYIAAGKGNSAEANDLREQMEVPEQHLSEAEQMRFNALSGDLSMIYNHEIPDEDVVARVAGGNLPLLLMEAYKQQDWEEVLALLRADVTSFLKPEQLAYMRSRAYAELREYGAAVAFIDEAARRNPAAAIYPALAMDLLLSDRQENQAFSRAVRFLQESATPNRLIIMSAGVLSRLADKDNASWDLIAPLRSALGRIDHAVKTERNPAIRYEGLVTLGLLAVHAGDNSRAEVAFAAALSDDAAPISFFTRGALMQELELVRSGKSRSSEQRALSSKLAISVAPRCSFDDQHNDYAIAA